MKQTGKKWLSLGLALCLCLGGLPIQAEGTDLREEINILQLQEKTLEEIRELLEAMGCQTKIVEGTQEGQSWQGVAVLMEDAWYVLDIQEEEVVLLGQPGLEEAGIQLDLEGLAETDDQSEEEKKEPEKAQPEPETPEVKEEEERQPETKTEEAKAETQTAEEQTVESGPETETEHAEGPLMMTEVPETLFSIGYPPLSQISVLTGTQAQRINWLVSTFFPDDGQVHYWNHVGSSDTTLASLEGLSSVPCPNHDTIYTCNNFFGSWQCMAFARYCAYKYSGSTRHFSMMNNEGLNPDGSRAQVGDIVKFNQYPYQHYAFVAGRSVDANGQVQLDILESNYNAPCQLNRRTVPAASVTGFYASEHKNPVTPSHTLNIRYLANGGTGTMPGTSVAADGTGSLAANQFKRSGYDFKGWHLLASRVINGKPVEYGVYKDSTGKPVLLTEAEAAQKKLSFYLYKDRASLSEAFFHDCDSITAQAQWIAHASTMQFEANGGAGTMPAKSLKAGAAVKLPASGFDRTGHAFAGWNVLINGDSAWYDVSGKPVLLPTSEGTAKKYSLAVFQPGTVFDSAQADIDLWKTVTLKAVWKDTGTYQMFRLYNPNTGEHFYTREAAEKHHLVQVGWIDEGIAWNAPRTSKTPVYRLYNPVAGDHHYTMDGNERKALIKAGWSDEGIGWYSDDAKGQVLYRQYNPNAKTGTHNFTTNKYERDHLVQLGWHDEGTAWYGLQ